MSSARALRKPSDSCNESPGLLRSSQTQLGPVEAQVGLAAAPLSSEPLAVPANEQQALLHK